MLFNETSINYLIDQCDSLKITSVQQVQRYPLSNHLFWLSQQKPGGHEIWAFLDSEKMHQVYEQTLAKLGCCDTLWVEIEQY